MKKEIRKTATNSGIVSIIGNTCLALAKGIAGIMGRSDALIADAIESLSDVLSSILALIGIRYTTRPADENHPYGHGKAEPLFTFIVVGFLLISATLIIVHGINNLGTNQPVPETYTFIIVIAVIVIKEGLYRKMKHTGEKINSGLLIADAWHHRSDAITSLVTLTGIGIALWGGEGFQTADDWAAIVAGAIIIINAYRIFRPALGEIMDEHVHEELIQRIREIAESNAQVFATEKCFARKTGMFYHVDLHLIVDGTKSVTEGHNIAHNVKDQIKNTLPQIEDVLIHVEPMPE